VDGQKTETMNLKMLLASLLFCIAGINNAMAQDRDYYNLSINNSLLSNQVYGSITDHYGYLWIATPKGVARYNGYDLKQFNLSEGLPYEDIWQLLEDKKGRIWLANVSNEIGYLSNNKYHKAFIKNTHGTIYPKELHPWQDGIIFWSHFMSGTQEITLCREKNDTISTTIIDKNIFTKEERAQEVEASNTEYIMHMLINSFDSIFLPYAKNIYRLDINRQNSIILHKLFSMNDEFLDFQYAHKFRSLQLLNNHIISYGQKGEKEFLVLSLKDNSVKKISLSDYGINDPVDYIYYPTDNNKSGFFYVFTKDQILQFQEKEDINYIKTIPIGKLTEGAQVSAYNSDDLWGQIVSTRNKGVYFSTTMANHFIAKKNLDLTDFKYIGGKTDDQCFWWSNKLNKLLKIAHDSVITSSIFQVEFDLNTIIPYAKDSFLLMGLDNYLITTNPERQIHLAKNRSSYTPQLIYAGITEEQGRILITSTIGIGCGYIENNIFNSTKILNPDRFKNVIYDSLTRDIWCYNNDKIFIHSRNSRDTTFANDQLSRFGVKKAEGIVIDNRYGNIFFKGQNNITIYNRRTNSYRQILKNYNLKESSIYIYNNDLIVAGRFGIIFAKILGTDSLSATVLYPNVKNINYNYIFDCQISWNKILLSTDKGTYEVKIPDDNEILNSRQQDFLLNYKFLLTYRDTVSSIHSQDTLTLSQKDLRLQFDVINPNGNGQLKYTYKLPGDSVWNELNANELNFPALSPDNYYKLTLSAHDNVWRSDDLTLYIYIRPHWWQTHNGKRVVWFSAIISVLLLFTIAVLITRRLVLNVTSKRNLQMELELKSIYAQINPHFIFNTLNSALLLVSKNKMEDAYVHIAKFSRLLRSYIKSSRNKLITVADEINNLKNYIELQQTRFKDRFDYNISLDEKISAQAVKIPSLLLQPFVENAINHGILNSHERGMLTIQFKKRDNENELVCVIEDNGVGRKQSKVINEANMDKDESYGDLMIRDLVNIFNKYEQMNIEIDYSDKVEPEKGTIVTIHIKNLQ
jgi:two-component sensor histidine kinase